MRDGNVYCCGLSERPAGDADVSRTGLLVSFAETRTALQLRSEEGATTALV